MTKFSHCSLKFLVPEEEETTTGAEVVNGVEDDVIVCLEDHIKECANADKDLTAVSAICTWLV